MVSDVKMRTHNISLDHPAIIERIIFEFPTVMMPMDDQEIIMGPSDTGLMTDFYFAEYSLFKIQCEPREMELQMKKNH